MRILFITNLYPPYHIGGYEIACKDIAEGLMERDHTVKVLTSTYGVGRPVINQHIAQLLGIKLKLNSTQTLIEKGSALFFNPSNYRITKNFIEKFNPDIVSFWNINGISASTILATEKRRVPKVFHLFDRNLSYLRKSGIKSLFNHVIFNRLHIKYLISSSSELKKDYVFRGFEENTITVIPHGIDIYKYPFEKKETDGILKLLYVGQLWEGKGVHILLKAISSLKKKNVNVKLKIIGSGVPYYVDKLKRICKEMKIADNVEFLGGIKRKNLIKYYHGGHILVFPSIIKEALGIVLLEAMATGTPVISSKRGGPLDIIDDSITGFFFEPGDFKDLTSKILLYEKNRHLINKMGKNARNIIEERFNIRKVVKQIESLYLQIIL